MQSAKQPTGKDNGAVIGGPPRRGRARRVQTDYAKNLGKSLKKLRSERFVSQAQLADRVGVPRSSVSKWESGLTVMTAEDVAKVVNVLGIDAGRFLGLDTQPSIDDAHERMMVVLRSCGRGLASKEFGLAETEWSRIDSGQFRFSIEFMKAMAKEYNISFGWIMTGRPEDWSDDLNGYLSHRLRYFRICIGMEIDKYPNPELIKYEASEPDAKMNIDTIRVFVEQIRAYLSTGDEMAVLFNKHFGRDLDWILSGKIQ